jgi:hypothetical protein
MLSYDHQHQSKIQHIQQPLGVQRDMCRCGTFCWSGKTQEHVAAAHRRWSLETAVAREKPESLRRYPQPGQTRLRAIDAVSSGGSDEMNHLDHRLLFSKILQTVWCGDSV